MKLITSVQDWLIHELSSIKQHATFYRLSLIFLFWWMWKGCPGRHADEPPCCSVLLVLCIPVRYHHIFLILYNILKRGEFFSKVTGWRRTDGPPNEPSDGKTCLYLFVGRLGFGTAEPVQSCFTLKGKFSSKPTQKTRNMEKEMNS